MDEPALAFSLTFSSTKHKTTVIIEKQEFLISLSSLLSPLSFHLPRPPSSPPRQNSNSIKIKNFFNHSKAPSPRIIEKFTVQNSIENFHRNSIEISQFEMPGISPKISSCFNGSSHIKPQELRLQLLRRRPNIIHQRSDLPLTASLLRPLEIRPTGLSPSPVFSLIRSLFLKLSLLISLLNSVSLPGFLTQLVLGHIEERKEGSGR
jgi:hypothetical protein